jgi:anti-sigma B factor antagonist
VALAGELDLVSAPLAQRRMAELLARGVDDVVLHLTGVTFVDSSGLRALLAIAEAAASVGTTLRILPGGPHLMAVVEAAGLLGRLPFAERDQP